MKNKFKKSFAAALAAIITLSASANYSLTTANAAELGDVNSDGTIDSSDATAILIYYANALLGNNVNINNSSTDVNGDGTVDSFDATVILIYYAHNLLGENYSIADIVSGNADTYDYHSLYDSAIEYTRNYAYEECGSYSYGGYMMFDINHDGIDELITITGNADCEISVWTIENGSAVDCGMLSTYSASLYCDSSNNLYSTTDIINNPDDWTYSLNKISLNGTSIGETMIYTDFNIYDAEDHGFTELEYTRF